MIKVNQLEKYFNKGKNNELHALKGVSVTFEDKGLVCTLGESGSGEDNAVKCDRWSGYLSGRFNGD